MPIAAWLAIAVRRSRSSSLKECASVFVSMYITPITSSSIHNGSAESRADALEEQTEAPDWNLGSVAASAVRTLTLSFITMSVMVRLMVMSPS